MRSKLYFIVFLLTHVVLILSLKFLMGPIRLADHNLLVAALIQKAIYLPFELLFLFEIGNLILIWLIGQKLFKKDLALIPVSVYAFVPWGIYLTVAGSFYIYLLFLLLIGFYGLLECLENKSRGQILLIGASVIGIYSSFFLLFIIPIILLGLVLTKTLVLKKFKRSALIIAALCIPLVLLILINRVGFGDVLKGEVQLFSDPGLINNVNRYQGEDQKAGYGKLGRVAENKYILTFEYSILKFTKQIVPPTFFTSQEKLLGFSASSPLYLGFLIPFGFGLFKLFKSRVLTIALMLSTLLTLPSFFAKQPVSLNRLFLFSPVVIFIISYGLILLFQRRKTKMKRTILTLTILFVCFQIFITLFDIQFLEQARFVQYFGQNYTLEKQ